MKYSKLIKLFSALLCVVMLFVSCSQGGGNNDQNNQGDDQNQNQPTVVEAKFENYFDLTYKPNYVNFTEAERLDFGRLNSRDDELLLFVDTEIDNLNMVKDTYTVYDASKQKVLCTFEDTYENLESPERYVDFDLIPGAVLKISALPGEKLTPEQLHELELSGVEDPAEYKYTYSLEFYNLAGEEFASYAVTMEDVFEDLFDTYDVYEKGNTTVIYIGNKAMVFDSLTYEMIACYNLDNEVAHAFDYVTDKYGYYIDCELSNYGQPPLIQVYNLEDGSLKINHVVTSKYYNEASAFVLDNGNIFVTVLNYIFDEETDYDFINTYSGMPVAIENYIIDVNTGDTVDVQLDYAIEGVGSASYLTAYEDIPLTENAVNVAFACKIEDKNLTKEAILFLDNDMKVLYAYEYDSLAYEALNTSFEVLSTGDLLIELDSEVADSAIVKADGKVRCYVPEGATVIEGAIVTEVGIYDYDLKPLYIFEDNDVEYINMLGGSVVVRELEVVDEEPGTGTNDDDDDDDDDAITLKYYMLTPTATGCTKKVISGEVYSVEDNYLIAIDEDTEKYVLYNGSLEKVLVTENAMTNIQNLDNTVLLETRIDGETVYYILK